MSSVLFVALVVSASIEHSCREHSESKQETATLEHGLTFMWTTPVLRIAMTPSDSERLRTLSDNIARRFDEFNRDGECALRRGETPNDAFFAKQLEAWERLQGVPKKIDLSHGTHGSAEAPALLKLGNLSLPHAASDHICERGVPILYAVHLD